ncbi:DUF2510 domain-containing protein [Propionibacterium freudenreichii]|uniref:DUF2510 domain-containing protein n=1 Tax=Propionibacterium freudenreichii TaxID=1744 RepID=UPI0005A5CFFA|nr:DUF2510 domain-containing protein [Propionibacterium freudenreichii]MDK9348102.1 DUF2510 domain-containing protein [Propionibacterium freudenreichii]MDK9353063.1 DUF2510 domain-containing protein [Propionibacterium freudenreichii]MDK9626743.1 DUF2510 domain-containing protein [Propionibacterium freudenreichii]MDK9652883.1 DUF2510 domain-containing protein [Propionibacterium freudenreichii]CEI31983.1 Hypothetical protein PFCIRM527_00355 [Propionibacterium freudenreichii]
MSSSGSWPGGGSTSGPTPGWYPDPAGAPGLYRYWDGHAWTGATTNDPAATPAPQVDSPTRSGTHRRGWIVAVLAVLVALGVIIAVVLTRGGAPWSGGNAPEDTNSASPTGSQWDETSTPTPSPSDNASHAPCPTTSATGVTRQASNKVLSGGGIQVDAISGWQPATMSLRWVSDLHTVADTVYTSHGFGVTHTWFSNIGVGALNAQDGFTDVRASAHSTLECYASTDYYDGFTGRKDLVDEQTTVDGHPAWHIQTEVYVTMRDIPQVRGDRVDIVVVDVGNRDHLGLFLGSSNLGDAGRNGKVDAAMKTLRVTG